LQVYGWHLNGAAEPWDSFFENNDTQSAIDNLDAAFEHLSSIPDREGQDFEAADDTEVTRVLRLMCGMATTTDIYAALVPRILADAGYQIVKAQTNQA
jgi:hypothetical protein